MKVTRETTTAKANSKAYAEALNATVYHLVTRALASHMVQGRKSNGVAGTIKGTFNTYEKAAKAVREGHTHSIPMGMDNGKMSMGRIASVVIVAAGPNGCTIVD